MMNDGSIEVGAGPAVAVKSIVAWNPETKEITSGPASGQFAENENEVIEKHKVALMVTKKERE